MRVLNRTLVSQLATAVLAVTLCATVTGCSKGSSPTTTAGTQPPATQPAETSAGPGGVSDAASQIPPGREIPEGGGGPVSYTFREEWRRGLAAAQKWRSGAYLITATGDMINDEGVPSSWSLIFLDKAAEDAVLIVGVDPWGKVTAQRQVNGTGVNSFVDNYTQQIPYDVIDSDSAVSAGKKALGARYNLKSTKDPRLALNFSATDGSGPYWNYTLFYISKAEYVTARIDALTGEIVPKQ